MQTFTSFLKSKMNKHHDVIMNVGMVGSKSKVSDSEMVRWLSAYSDCANTLHQWRKDQTTRLEYQDKLYVEYKDRCAQFPSR